MEEVAGLVGDGFQGGAGEFLGGGAAGEAGDDGLGVAVPVGGAEAGEGGDEVDALVRVGLSSQGVGFGGGFDEAQAVAEPLDGGAGGEDGALESVVPLAADLVGDGGEQAVGRRYWPRGRC